METKTRNGISPLKEEVVPSICVIREYDIVAKPISPREGDDWIGEVASSANVVAALSRKILGDSAREKLLAFFLNAQLRIIGYTVVAIGGVSEIRFSVGEVYRALLASGADALILVHNHPTGNASPSEVDLKTFEQMKLAAQVLSVQLLDSIILGDGEFYSHARAEIKKEDHA